MRKFAFLAVALTAASPVLAQTVETTPAVTAETTSTSTATTATATPSVAPKAVATGQTVRDTAGGEVGTVSKVENNLAVIATGTHEVALPLTSFALADTGPVIALTKDQLNAEAAKAKAAAPAATAKP